MCVCVHAHTCIGATEYVWRTELVLSIYWMGSRLDLGLSGLTINIPLAESPGWPHLKTKLHVFFNLWGGGTCVRMWRSGSNFWECVLSFYCGGPRMELRTSGLVAPPFLAEPSHCVLPLSVRDVQIQGQVRQSGKHHGKFPSSSSGWSFSAMSDFAW